MISSAARPYRDELLSSALIRVCRRYRISSFRLGLDVLKLPGWRLSFLGGLPLPSICELLGMRAEPLLRQHTPLPYAGAYSSEATYRRCWVDALTGAESPPLRALMRNAVSAPSVRKYCTSCVSEDLRVSGESYWHVCHQLPGVLACATHNHALRWTGIPFNKKGAGQLLLPSECRGMRIRLESPALIDLAHASAGLMKSIEPNQRPSSFYRRLAETHGSLDPDRPVSEVALNILLKKHFSGGFLRSHGLLDSDGVASWAALMFRPHVQFGFAPIKHLLLHTALSAGQPAASVSLSHRSGGPPVSDRGMVDAYYSRAAKEVLSRALSQDKVLTTTQFLRAAGCYGAYRHRKHDLPSLRRVVLAFRHSSASVKPLNSGKILFRTRPEERVGR